MDVNTPERAPSIIKTKDGSDTLYSPHFDAHYHSTHGAIQESLHVFIDAGLDYLRQADYSQIHVLEIGWGTGLNSLLALRYADLHHLPLYYHTIEAYPIKLSTADELNYTEGKRLQRTFLQLHELSWDQEHEIGDHFTFRKDLGQFEEVTLRDNYNVIFFDAFAPNCQPHLWEAPFLTKLCERLTPGGVLVTYCAQGAFKRALKSIGMKVTGIPGPPGKREMTRAIKL